MLRAAGVVALLTGPAGGLVFDRDFLRDLPSSRDVWSLVESVDPLCIVDRLDNGGLHAGEPGRVGCHGSSWTQAAFLLDGLDVTDPDRGGTPLFVPDLLALESVTVRRERLPASFAGAGASFELTTRRPARDWSGAIEAHGTDGRLQGASATPPPTARYGRAHRVAALLQGPLVREPVSFLLSAGDSGASRLEPRDPRPLASRNRSLLARMVVTPRDGEEARILAGVQDSTRPLAGRALYSNRDLSEAERLGHVQATWERHSDERRFRLGAGYSRASLRPHVETAPDGVVERLLDGPGPELVPARNVRRRWIADARWAATLGTLAAGPHALELGLSLSHASLVATSTATPGLVGETVDGLPARAWEYGYADTASRRQATELALDASDRISPTRRLELGAGVRFEATRASARGGGRIGWLTLSPRLSARWRALDGIRLGVFAAYGRYRQRLALRALAFGDPAAAAGASYLWTDANGDGRIQPSERGALVARVGPGGSLAAIDPRLEPPRSDELLLGIEAEPAAGLTLRFTAIQRKERDLLESVNVGVPLASYRVSGIPDPYVDFVGPADDRVLPLYDRDPASFGLDRYLLTNPAGHSLLHEGFEVSAEKALGRLRLLLGAAANRTDAKSGWRGFRAGENDQGLIGELFDDPNAGSYARGRVFFDRNYVVKLAGSYRSSGDVHVGAAVRYQDGQPFARFVVAPDLRQGPDIVQAVPEGRHRFSYTLTVDARVEKGFRVRSERLALVLEAFNLLDARNSVEEEVVTSPAFRDRLTRLVQPPRALRLGLRLEL